MSVCIFSVVLSGAKASPEPVATLDTVSLSRLLVPVIGVFLPLSERCKAVTLETVC